MLGRDPQHLAERPVATAMRDTAIPVSALSNPTRGHKEELISQLKTRGFGLLKLDIDERAEAIEEGLAEAAQL